MLPFLRWAGGKRKLAPIISSAIPASFFSSDKNYIEPFVGGGAIMLHLGDVESQLFLPGKRLYINDLNPDLVITYQTIRDDVESLIEKLDELSRDLSKENYLRIRAEVPEINIERAARFIYLNKTSFNGLWRVNSRGLYNVPWGQLKNPTIFNPMNLRAVAGRLTDSRITHQDYRTALSEAKKGDLVYLDPPYIPISVSANFSKYAKEDFNLDDQKELAATINELSEKGVRVILSNSDTELSREIFAPVLNLKQISVSRLIAAKSGSRGHVMEILGTNFDIEKGTELSNLSDIASTLDSNFQP